MIFQLYIDVLKHTNYLLLHKKILLKRKIKTKNIEIKPNSCTKIYKILFFNLKRSTYLYNYFSP